MKTSLFRVMAVLGILGSCLLFSADDAGAALCTVAVEEIAIGSGVGKNAKRHLNREQLQDEIETALRETRKFQVVTRQQKILSLVRKEQAFAKTTVAKGNAAIEGQADNAQLLIAITVHDFKFGRSVKPVPNIANKYFRQDYGRLAVNAKVVNTSSMAVVKEVNLESRTGSKKHIVNHSGGMPDSSYYTKMARRIGVKLAEEVLDAQFPMKIIRCKGTQVFINRGKDGGLKTGDILNVYSQGEMMIDPDTNENIGADEMMIGQIKVVRVNPKFTIAKIKGEETRTLISSDLSGSAPSHPIVRRP